MKACAVQERACALRRRKYPRQRCAHRYTQHNVHSFIQTASRQPGTHDSSTLHNVLTHKSIHASATSTPRCLIHPTVDVIRTCLHQYNTAVLEYKRTWRVPDTTCRTANTKSPRRSHPWKVTTVWAAIHGLQNVNPTTTLVGEGINTVYI